MPTMSSIRLYVPDLSPGITLLGTEEAHHAIHVLRVRRGDAVVAFNGTGHEGVGVISAASRDGVEIEVANVALRDFDVSYRLTLAVAMGKVHRQGYLIEKCTELGVAAIWPMIAQRSVARPRDGATDKRRRRAIEAAKQSGRAWIPQIRSPLGFDDVVAERGSFELALIADTAESSTPLSPVISRAPVDSKILALVGPEGGWTDQECAHAVDAGFLPVSLAPTTLRTETAAVAVCAVIAMLSNSK